MGYIFKVYRICDVKPIQVIKKKKNVAANEKRNITFQRCDMFVYSEFGFI